MYPRYRFGFTLIEVLVVVGVIGLLVSILVPSLAKSRQQARAVVCMSNMREWGKAIQMYADDHDETLPFESRPMSPEADTDASNPYYPYVWKDNGRVCWFDCMDKYFGYRNTAENFDETVKLCPSVRRTDPEAEESYRMNSKLAESDETSRYYHPFRKLDTLKRRNRTVLLFGAEVSVSGRIAFKGRWRPADSKPGSDVAYRHLKKTHVLFADWHLENITKKQLSRRSTYNEQIVWKPADMGQWSAYPTPGED